MEKIYEDLDLTPEAQETLDTRVNQLSQKIREGTEKRISKNTISKDDFENYKNTTDQKLEKALSALEGYQNKEMFNIVDKAYKTLPIKEEFMDDVKSIVQNKITYDGIENNAKSKANHFIKETKRFIQTNQRFMVEGEPSLIPSKEDAKPEKPLTPEEKQEKAKLAYQNAFNE